MLLANPVTCWEVPGIPELFAIIFAKALSVATCRLYQLAPVDAFQPNVIDADWLVAPFPGVTNDGADGADAPAAVAKLHVEDQLPVRTSVDALTRQ